MTLFLAALTIVASLLLLLYLSERHTKPSDIEGAVRAAFYDCGLPVDQFSREFDIAATGKLHEVIQHVAMRQGSPHPLRTVQDVMDLFEGR